MGGGDVWWVRRRERWDGELHGSRGGFPEMGIYKVGVRAEVEFYFCSSYPRVVRFLGRKHTGF